MKLNRVKTFYRSNSIFILVIINGLLPIFWLIRIFTFVISVLLTDLLNYIDKILPNEESYIIFLDTLLLYLPTIIEILLIIGFHYICFKNIICLPKLNKFQYILLSTTIFITLIFIFYIILLILDPPYIYNTKFVMILSELPWNNFFYTGPALLFYYPIDKEIYYSSELLRTYSLDARDFTKNLYYMYPSLILSVLVLTNIFAEKKKVTLKIALYLMLFIWTWFFSNIFVGIPDEWGILDIPVWNLS